MKRTKGRFNGRPTAPRPGDRASTPPPPPEPTAPVSADPEPRLLWGVDAAAVGTLCSMRLEISSTLLRRSADRFTGHDAVADTALVHRLTSITPEVGLQLPADRIENPDELVAHATDAEVRIGAVLPDVSARPGRPFALCHPDSELSARALAALYRAAGVAQDVRARRLVIRLHDSAPYPGQTEARRRLDQLADVLAGLRRQLPPDLVVVVDHAIRDPHPVRRARPDWQTALSLATAAGPGTKVLLEPAPFIDEDPELSITTLRSGDRLAGVLLGRQVAIDRPFALFLAMIDAAEGGVLVRGRRCPVPFVVALPPGRTPGIEAALRAVGAVQEAAAKAMLLDRSAWRAARAAGDTQAETEILLTAYETDATPLLTAVRAALGVPADAIASYRELCRDTHRAVERQRSLLRAALRQGEESIGLVGGGRVVAAGGGRVGRWALRGVS